MEPPYSAATVALSLPELVSEILAFYFNPEDCGRAQDHPNYAAAIRVNSLWFDCGIDHLWAISDPFTHLRNVSPERRQIYASRVQHLSVWYANEYRHLSMFDDLEFRRLKHVSATVSSMASLDVYRMTHIFVQSLQTFEFNGPHVSADILELLQDGCPNLKRVGLNTYEYPATTASIAEFIRNMPSLEVFAFETSGTSAASSHSIDGDLLLSLARSKRLTKLQVPWEWSMDAAEFATRRLADMESHSEVKPFPSLMVLNLSAPASAIRTLAPMLRNVSCLHLTVKTADGDPIAPLGELINLKCLKVTFRYAMYIPGASLAGLATLSKLEVLDLKPLHPILTKVTSCFSDADLELVAPCWPRLQSLGFGIKCAVSATGIRVLARHCRELRKWEMVGPLKIDELLPYGFAGAALFPKLECLRFDGFAGVVYDRDRFVSISTIRSLFETTTY
ncbi:hypothetical protein V8C26DRAFT_8964 [Trichoderma gracile]